MARKSKKTNKKIFNVGDFVLAKVKGFPLWPARVVEIPKPGKYEVLFFETKEIGKQILEIKPFNASGLPPDSKNKRLRAAYEECQEQYEKVVGSSPLRESPNESPKHLEIDNNQEVVESSPSRDSPNELPKHLEIDSDQKVATSSQSYSPDNLPKHLEIDDHQATSKSSLPTDSPNESPKHMEIDNGQETTVAKHEPENSTSVDCSLNDLTSEQANADRGIKKPITKSAIAPDNNKVKTIEKLKKKLQKKLDEKEGKKKNRREKKEFEKASNLLPRFIRSYKKLIKNGKMFIAMPNEKNEQDLESSMKSISDAKHLEQLSKCVTAVSSEYGRMQEESKQFHAVLCDLCQTLNEVLDTSDKDILQTVLDLKSKFKNEKQIKEFVMKFDNSLNETKEEQIVERKENARKRTKLSR